MEKWRKEMEVNFILFTFISCSTFSHLYIFFFDTEEEEWDESKTKNIIVFTNVQLSCRIIMGMCPRKKNRGDGIEKRS